MSTPLQGIKVLDFTGVQSGPSYTQMLAGLALTLLKLNVPALVT